jgi:hypothetical protein
MHLQLPPRILRVSKKEVFDIEGLPCNSHLELNIALTLTKIIKHVANTNAFIISFLLIKFCDGADVPI